MRSLAVFAALLTTCACVGCDVPSGNDGGVVIKPPPQVFLTVTESNVIGQRITGKVNVSGCKNVAQVQLLESGQFLADLNYTTSPTDFSLEQGLFATLWPKLGFAASLTFTAFVQCDDGRNNKSQPLGVTFFPVASRLSNPQGQMLPESFVVEGGLGGSAVTFLGCLYATTGNPIGRVNTNGEVVATVNSGDVPSCTFDAQISELSTATGTRWVLQPGEAAYAVDRTLKVLKVVRGKFERMGVDPKNGSAILWDSTINAEKILKLEPVASTANDWARTIAGLVNSTPVIDAAHRVAWVSTWQFDVGPRTGDLVTWKLNLDNGSLLNGVGTGGPPIVIRQTFGQTVNTPIMPEGYFSADGELIFMPLLNVDGSGVVHTTIVACSSYAVCDASTPARRWTSRTFDGVVNLVVPFSKGNYLAAVGPYQTWFLETQQGKVKNLGEVPIRPSSTMQFLGIQPGAGADVYLLAGPVIEGMPSFPTQAIAVDDPVRGELFRFDYGSGESPLGGMYLGIDESGQSWFRVGPDQVKPNTIAEYRLKRGPTIVP